MHDLAPEAERTGELARAVERAAITREGDVEREVAVRNRARDGVLEDVADGEVFEAVAAAGFGCGHAAGGSFRARRLYTPPTPLDRFAWEPGPAHQSGRRSE